MHGIHDIGGMAGFGPVVREPDEPAFHEHWERRAAALTIASFSMFNGGAFRHSIERMHPLHYLGSGYYEHWLTGTATLLVERGHITRDELEATAPNFPLAQPITAQQPHVGDDNDTPRFHPGDRVRVKQQAWPGHTRCPNYVQGRRGIVVRNDIVASVPDVEAHSKQRQHAPTYSVRFEARELWGDDPDNANSSIHVDLWETYLEPLEPAAP
jgi:nitrile hydratase subunit beta